VNIIDDIFRKTKRLREVEAEDNDDDNYIKIKFDVQGLGSPKTSLPIKSITLELDGTASPVASVSPNSVVYEIKGSENPPSFVPYNFVRHHTHRI
jgi:hypothetical protein